MPSDPLLPLTVEPEDREDEAAEIRYSLSALGERLVAERARPRFRGFGPCPVAFSTVAG